MKWPPRLLLCVCVGLIAGCGGKKKDKGPPPLVPYKGYFQADAGGDIYLFADLGQKIKYDLDPSAVSYREFVSRIGKRVYVSEADPKLVPRIALGYEEANDTELTPAGAASAPPPRTAAPVTTRRSFNAPPSDLATTLPVPPPVGATTRPDQTRLPPQELGPVGEPATLPSTRPATRRTTPPTPQPLGQ